MPDVPPSPRPRPRWRRWALEVLIVLVALAAFQLWQLRDAVRGPAPAVAGERLDGSPFDLAAWRAGQHGRATLLYFWAEWCPICKTTAGNVTAVTEDWPVTSVASQSGPAAQVAGHLRAAGHSWPTLADPRADILRRFGVPGVPAFVVIDPRGDVRFVTLGYTSEIGLRLRFWWATWSGA